MLRPFGPNHYASMASSAANAAAAAAIVSYLSPLFQTSVMISLSDPMHGLNPLTGPNQGRKMNIRVCKQGQREESSHSLTHSLTSFRKCPLSILIYKAGAAELTLHTSFPDISK
ncbi:hypothetical protein TWF132_006493 [Orbilia oligospora]|nr:hypothetical protein TWF132_006493 [Orbilia oligospora]